MKQLLIFSFLALSLSACGNDEAATGAGNDPLDQVPTAEEAAEAADAIDADNAEKTLDDLEAELNSDG